MRMSIKQAFLCIGVVAALVKCVTLLRSSYYDEYHTACDMLARIGADRFSVKGFDDGLFYNVVKATFSLKERPDTRIVLREPESASRAIIRVSQLGEFEFAAKLKTPEFVFYQDFIEVGDEGSLQRIFPFSLEGPGDLVNRYDELLTHFRSLPDGQLSGTVEIVRDGVPCVYQYEIRRGTIQ